MISLNMHLPEQVYFKLLNTEDALTVAKYPASGAFIDVSGFKKFGFIVAAGALDTPIVLQVEAANAANGTPADITGATATISATQDDTLKIISVDQDELSDPNGQRYVTLDVTGPTGNDYGAIIFFGQPLGLPAVQESTTEVVLVDPS